MITSLFINNVFPLIVRTRSALKFQLYMQAEIIEKYWAYFLGFGLPCVLVLTFVPTLPAYFILLAMSPLRVILAVQSDFPALYKGYSTRHSPMPLFPFIRLIRALFRAHRDSAAYFSKSSPSAQPVESESSYLSTKQDELFCDDA